MKLYLIVFQLLVVYLAINSGFSQNGFKKVEIEDIAYRGTFSPKAISNIRSMKDGEHYTILKNDFILSYSYKTGNLTDTLFSPLWANNNSIKGISEYEFSDDETTILLETAQQHIYRHSYTANYFVFKRNTRQISEVSVTGSQQLATISPDSKHIAFVRENNLFVNNLETGKEQAISTDGKFNEIINGAPDWVYEEEFGFSKAFAWSPDGTEIAYMRFDESKVPLFSMVKYDSLYPTVHTFKYPKAGDANAVVSVWVYNLQAKSAKRMDVGSETDQYIPRIKWTAQKGFLSITRLNRLQNKVDVLVANTNSGNSRELYSETNKYFISEVNDNFITFTIDGSKFMVFSERSGYKHLYLYSMQGQLLNVVTKGDYDVTDLLAVDNKLQRVYYRSAETSPLNREVYSIGFDGSAKKRISILEGTSTAEFSSSFKYYILTYSNANSPATYTLFSEKGKSVRVLEDNGGLCKRIAQYGFQKKEFIKVPVANNLELNAFIIKPEGFDSLKKYPLFMYVYGGPESQDVTNSWDRYMGWYQHLAQHGYIVACVDNRGTDGRGEAFKKSTYLQLGKLEVEDQLNAARYLGSLPYIDKSRIGIYGWSYGGFMSSLCMTIGNGVFKLGIAVAPVTNWRYYDNIYTERFMRTPQENPNGYDDNSPINFADKLQGNFLLIHGSADDNVHLQNTMVFAEKLVQANKKFDMEIYTDRNHGIYGGKTRLHLYTRMTDYILKNL